MKKEQERSNQQREVIQLIPITIPIILMPLDYWIGLTLKRRSMAALLPRWAELEVAGNTGAAAMEVRPKGTCLSRCK